MGIICAPTSWIGQQHAVDKPITESRLIPVSETDGALKGILTVRAEPCTLKYLLEGYPGFEVMKAVAELSKDLQASPHRDPPICSRRELQRGHQSREQP